MKEKAELGVRILEFSPKHPSLPETLGKPLHTPSSHCRLLAEEWIRPGSPRQDYEADQCVCDCFRGVCSLLQGPQPHAQSHTVCNSPLRKTAFWKGSGSFLQIHIY